MSHRLPPLQATSGLRTLTDAWGTVEAAMAAGLHDMLATMLAALPWDDHAHTVAYRHMPEVWAPPKSTVLFQAAVIEATCGRSDGQSS
jgi:hypothetical protein